MTDRRGPSIDDVRRSIERLSSSRPPAAPAPLDVPPSAAPGERPVPSQAGAPEPPGATGTKTVTGPAAKPRAPASRGTKAAAPEAPKRPGPALRSSAGQRPAGPAPAGVPIDPRIKRRRIDVRRDEGRKRLRILLGCLGIVGAVAAAAAATRSPLFDVDYADVRGAELTPRAEILRAGGLDGRPAMLDVDTGSVAAAVEALPWVLEATARREWPGTIRVDVTEREPAAVLPAAAGQWALADRTGRILQIGPEKPPGLPVIGNIPPPEQAGASVPEAATPSLEVAAALPAGVRERVADIATLGTGDVELQLTPPGGVVRLGPPVDLDTKLSVLATFLARADLARVRIVDVRVPRAPALTRR